jgi:hypothetical protein
MQTKQTLEEIILITQMMMNIDGRNVSKLP